jgi:hypothetical protein
MLQATSLTYSGPLTTASHWKTPWAYFFRPDTPAEAIYGWS